VTRGLRVNNSPVPRETHYDVTTATCMDADPSEHCALSQMIVIG